MKRSETGQGSENVGGLEGEFVIPSKMQKNASRKFGEYRNSRLKLPKYRKKNYSTPQYRKPQCPPLLVVSTRVSVMLDNPLGGTPIF